MPVSQKRITGRKVRQFVANMFQLLDLVSNRRNFLPVIRFCETGVDVARLLKVVGGLFKVREEFIVLG